MMFFILESDAGHDGFTWVAGNTDEFIGVVAVFTDQVVVGLRTTVTR